MKFSIKDFFSKCDHIRSVLWIWSHTEEILNGKFFCNDLVQVGHLKLQMLRNNRNINGKMKTNVNSIAIIKHKKEFTKASICNKVSLLCLVNHIYLEEIHYLLDSF